MITANETSSTVHVFGVAANGKLTPVGTPTTLRARPTVVALVGLP
jgi:hypothetical protein